MTNPYPTMPTRIDIRASADRVVEEARQGQLAEAFDLLAEARRGQRTAVQEALDRYVAADLRADLPGLGQPGTPGGEAGQTIERLTRALGPPRIPVYSHLPATPNELVGLTDAQRYDIYASMVAVRGNEAARNELGADGRSILLGLRRENSTLASPGEARRGTGIYDDQILVLTRTVEGTKQIFIAGRATTEPTAQYSHQAGSDGNRPFSDRTFERRRIAPAGGYENVAWRKIEGEDVDGDSMRDLGRLAEGTVEMHLARHNNPAIAGTDVAFRPSPEQLAPGRLGQMVERDTNGDGYFTAIDQNGIQDLNRSFKIHSGSRNNTDSAGCQTIHPEDYRAFIDAAQSNPRQTRWQYVLTSTEGGLFHNVEVGRDAPQPAAQPEAPEPGEPREAGQASRHATGPFDDPGLNRYLAAVIAGDGAKTNRIALGFSFRAPEAAAQSMGHDPAKPTPSNEVQIASAQREAPGLQV